VLKGLGLHAGAVARKGASGDGSALSADAHGQDFSGAVVRSTFLYTDGLANAGVTKADHICAAVAAKLSELASDRCTLSTFGYGTDHDAELLQELAQQGEGSYSYIGSEETIAQAFGAAIGGLLTTSHQNVEISLKLAPGIRLVKAHTDFTVQQRSDVVDIAVGDLFAEARKDVLLTFELPKETLDGQSHVATVHARGYRVLSPPGSEATAHLALQLERRQLSDAKRDANPHVMRHRNRHVATEALAEARSKAKAGDLERARALLQAAVDELGASPLASSGEALTLGLLTDLKDLQEDLQDREAYRAVGSKKMCSMHTCHAYQTQSFGVHAVSTESYWNASMRTHGAQWSNSVM